MGAPNAFTERDLAEARRELSSGKSPTVWFTSAAVGVPVNGSAKVVSIDDVAEGDFIQVRPAGTRDTMFCSPSELTRTRPPRKRTQPRAEQAPEPEPAVPEATPSPAANPSPSASAPPLPARTPPARAERAAPPARTPPSGKPDRPRSAGGRSAGRPAEVTVTLNATAEGEWTVEVMVGKKRTVRPTPVQPAEVAKAARSLPTAVTEAIESSLEAARQRQLERVERLRAELEAAQRTLQELDS